MTVKLCSKCKNAFGKAVKSGMVKSKRPPIPETKILKLFKAIEVNSRKKKEVRLTIKQICTKFGVAISTYYLHSRKSKKVGE